MNYITVSAQITKPNAQAQIMLSFGQSSRELFTPCDKCKHLAREHQDKARVPSRHDGSLSQFQHLAFHISYFNLFIIITKTKRFHSKSNIAFFIIQDFFSVNCMEMHFS